MSKIILIRGGGDLASGVALRLYHAGFNILITELPQPLAVRRAVAFSEAVYEESWRVEGVTARLVHNAEECAECLARREIPVLIDPELALLPTLPEQPFAIIDARLLKQPPPPLNAAAPLTLGLGPGFTAGLNCHAVLETQRGHTLGRVYWKGAANADSGQPEGDPRRVLRAPASGRLLNGRRIGEHFEVGQTIATVDGQAILAPFAGVLRGLIRPGLEVSQGMKVGDLDPRDKREHCFLVSDKALAIGGGALEAILAHQTAENRKRTGGA